MPTSLNVKESASPRDRMRGLAEGGTKGVIEALIAIGVVFLAIYLSLLIGPAEVELGQILGP
jgi:hypothetical protein